MEKKRKQWIRYLLLCLGSLVSLVGPLVAILIANRARYFTTVQSTVKIGIGGMICILLVVLLVLGKLKMPGGLITLAFVFVMSWLLEPLVADLRLLSGAALAGKAVDWIIFAPALRRMREKIKINEQADVSATATAAAMEDVLKKYIGRV